MTVFSLSLLFHSQDISMRNSEAQIHNQEVQQHLECRQVHCSQESEVNFTSRGKIHKRQLSRPVYRGKYGHVTIFQFRLQRTSMDGI
uniref:Uncharacterized protein n=1 Tax=Zea mays TaxID=4577 RepID=C0PJK7_MAIZE|nr:unknown [Zea mays]